MLCCQRDLVCCRSRWFLVWFSLSTLYMLGFLTLMSVIAGYLTPSNAGFNMLDGIFLTADSPEFKTCYNLTAGALFRYQNGTIIPGPSVSQFDIDNPSTSFSQTNGMVSLLSQLQGIKTHYPVFVYLYNGESSSSSQIHHFRTNLLCASCKSRRLSRGGKIYDATNTSTPPPKLRVIMLFHPTLPKLQSTTTSTNSTTTTSASLMQDGFATAKQSYKTYPL